MVAYTFIQVAATVWAAGASLSFLHTFLTYSGQLPPLKQGDDMNQQHPAPSSSPSRAASSFPPTSAVPTLSTTATMKDNNNNKKSTPSPQQAAAPSTTTTKTAYSAWFAPTTAAAVAAPPTTTPVVEQGTAVKTVQTTDTSSSPPSTGSSWSFFQGFVAASVVALAAPLSLLILGRLFSTTAEKNSSSSNTSYSLIQAALRERLSGKGHKSTSMTSGGGLEWDAKNYAQLTMEEIQRLLAILKAPAYHKNSSRSCGLNKRDLLHVLYQQYSNLLQDCNTQELRNILDRQGVAMPSGVIAKNELVRMALHAGFTGAAVAY